MVRQAKSKAARSALIVREGRLAQARRKKRAEELLALIGRRLQRIREDFYEIGITLKELRDEKLHVALGYGSFDALLAHRKPIGRSQAYKLIAIVEHLTREQALDIGEERAYALARLTAATPRAESVATVIEHGVEVGSKRRAVRSMSVREIEATVRRVSPKKRSPAEKAASEAARHAQRALRGRGLRDARVASKFERHRWWAAILVPIDDLPLLVGER